VSVEPICSTTTSFRWRGGGRTTADNLRLLCAAHSQYEADRKLGREFMEQKRANTPPLVNHERRPLDFEGAADVKAALITLGYRKDEVLNAMEFAAGLPTPLTAPERVKAILRQRHVKVTGQSLPAATP
jgi:hypothetical protein